ncbi:pentapeptide repeat-containing protein [Nonomuraea sp. NPDC003709]|uniref:pentapeptide repeat-containing protein n=1 Tax=Nonomuraea sp. NPDC003709 TaxID=3154450 RepID=UPI0033B35930
MATSLFPPALPHNEDAGGVVGKSSGRSVDLSSRISSHKQGFLVSARILVGLSIALVMISSATAIAKLVNVFDAKSVNTLLYASATILGVVAPAGLVAIYAFWLGRKAPPKDLPDPRRAQVVLGYAEQLRLATSKLATEDELSRIGAVYALGALARGSQQSERATVDALARFIRTRARPATPRLTRENISLDSDVQLALRILGSRDIAQIISTGVNIDLSGLDLRGADLSDLDFRGVSFRNSLLDQADLTRAQFDASDLSFCSMRASIAIDASFTNAILDHVDLSDSTLGGATLQSVWLNGSRLTRLLAPEIDLTAAIMPAVDLSYANLTDASLRSAFVSEAVLDYSNLEGVDFTGAILDGARINNAKLYNAKFAMVSIDSIVAQRNEGTPTEAPKALLSSVGKERTRK